MKVYIAGKMAGDAGYKEKFRAAEHTLRARGHTPMHSAELPGGFEHEEYLHICYAMIDVCDMVYLRPDWEGSVGARKERKYARKRHKPVRILEEEI